MKWVKCDKEKQRIPIKSWCEDIEDGAMEQIYDISNLPFAYHHIAVMPDCHQGYGMPIGGVMACNSVIVPNAVGVDIGCGMQAIQTNIESIDIELLKKIMGTIRESIPVGFNHHKESKEWMGFEEAPGITIIQRELQSEKYQLGTIPIDSNLGKEYLGAMNYALRFARQNRFLMMERIKESFMKHISSDILFNKQIDIHHNYAAMENHFGKNVMIHRKGAVRMRESEIGIIPGSQGTASYIVKGKGNKDSFFSCSHGAGRCMGRKQAQRELDFDTEVKRLDDQGILHSIRGKDDLDEASGAYKDIEEVMEAQEDLVEILVKLTPLGVIKG